MRHVADRGVVRQQRREGDHLLAIDVLVVDAAHAVAEVLELPHEIPGGLAAQLGGVQVPISLGLGAVAGRARREQRLTGSDVARHLARALSNVGCCDNQASKSACSSTITRPRMAKWADPQSCSHRASNCPVRVGVSQK